MGGREGGSSVNDRHSVVCERESTPSHAAPGLTFQLSTLITVNFGETLNFATSPVRLGRRLCNARGPRVKT